ncbi:MAG: DUF559 domain-containing protein, partial [Bacteroidia bacterium]
IVEVVTGGDISKESYDAKEGTLINSDLLNGLEVKAAIKKIISEIEKRGLGKGQTNYRLRDAIFGRQRYWGEPIPIYYKDGIPFTVDEKDLPVVLPEVDKYLPTEDGEPPLARAEDWTYTPHPSPPRGGGSDEPFRFKKREEGSVPEFETADKKFYPEIKESSRDKRKNPTEAEEVLWTYLRKEQTGYKIRRQHVIDIYIADFVCLEKKVVIEVDGKYHDEQIDYDSARTEMLQVKGFSVIRFTNEEVINNPKEVQQQIKKYLDAVSASDSLPSGEGRGGAYPLETTTMPGWAGSSWYYLRYMDAHNENEFASREAMNYWKDVDLYIGGSEHATGHLLYVRFWTKFLFDLGLIPVIEPAKKLINQGMIQGISQKIYRINRRGRFSSNVIGGILFDPEKLNVSSIDFSDPINSYVIFWSEENIENAKIALQQKGEPINNLETKIKQEIQFLDNVDISLADEKGYLDIKEFIKRKPEYSDAVFICTGGYHHKDQFIKFERNAFYKDQDELKGTDKFKLVPEVEKMSKSKYNVVTPDDIVNDYGADCLRLYEMFLGPLEQSKPWNTNGISGVSNFIRKLWRLFHKENQVSSIKYQDNFVVSDDPASKAELKTLHKTIKKATEDIERYSFNTSVSNFMICVNELTEIKCSKREILEPLVILISPYAPHIAEELWEKLGHNESITQATFPEFKEEYLVEDSFEYPVSINGKTRFKIPLSLQLTKEQVEKEVLSADELKKYLDGNSPKKVIVVPGRIVNVVV